MKRRPFLFLAAAGIVGCGEQLVRHKGMRLDCEEGVVTMYDMNAVALYLDGTEGPYTGVIYVDYILAGAPVMIDFWHGHGGQLHRYELLPEHIELLKTGERVYIETTEVANHSHTLYIDPLASEHYVPGAEPVEVPVDLGIEACLEISPLEFPFTHQP